MRKPVRQMCPIHNEPLVETEPADAENGPSPSDVYNRLVCPSCPTEVTLATDDLPDFWEVFNEPFHGVRRQPKLDESRPPILVLRVLDARPRAGDDEIHVLPVVGGGMAYFDAGPEYQWMRAPKGMDVRAWIASVKAAAA